MKIPADIGVYDEFGQMLLLAEVRFRDSSTPEWAIEVRQDVLRVLTRHVPPYFLVVSHDYSYLWLSAAAADARPGRTFVTEELFASYLRRVERTTTEISRGAMELIVGIWLRDVARGDAAARSVLPRDLELAADLENGQIEFAAAA